MSRARPGQDREVGAVRHRDARRELHADLPAAEAADAGHRQGGRRRLGDSLRGEADVSTLDPGLQPAAEFDDAALRVIDQPPDLIGAAAPEGHGGSGCALRQSLQREAADRRMERRECVLADRSCGLSTGLGEDISHNPLERLRLFRELRLGLGDRRLGVGTDLPEHWQDLIAEPVPRIDRLGVRGVVAERQAGGGR